MNSCDGKCGSCSAVCDDREPRNTVHERTKINKIIAVTSGKGGVGKSSITSLIASKMAKLGYKVGILDADITGPSIPKAFGLKPGSVQGAEGGMLPNKSKNGIDIMSLNLLVRNEDDPVAWRGPILSSAVTQFYNDTIWEDLDFLFIDMPPGTGDVTLTVFQSIPLDGIIVVTSPQDLVSMVVKKQIKLAENMDIKIVGMIENYSYYKCDDCDKFIEVFGKSKAEQVAKELEINMLAKLRIDPNLAALIDQGLVEDYETNDLDLTSHYLIKLLKDEECCNHAGTNQEDFVPCENCICQH